MPSSDGQLRVRARHLQTRLRLMRVPCVQVVVAKERESKRVLAVQRAFNAVKAANEEIKHALQPEISVLVET